MSILAKMDYFVNIIKRCVSYLEPFVPLWYAAWALRITLFAAARAHGVKGILAFSRLRDEAFALWYRTISPHVIRFEESTALPDLIARANGTILELGPGTGNQLPRFNQTKIHHIYGIEPNGFFAADIEAALEATGLRDRYTLIIGGVEDSDILERHGIVDGSLDTVLSVQVLCSVEKPEAVAKSLYKLLKPGGRLIFWEHHRSHDTMTRIVQSLWNCLWRFGVGSCNIERDMLGILKEAGRWEDFVTVQGDGEPWSMTPRIWGELVKSEAEG